MYTPERNLELKVSTMIDEKIRSVIGNNINPIINKLNVFKFEGEIYYLKKHVNSGLEISIDKLTKILYEQIKTNSLDISKIKPTSLSGREVKGDRLYYKDDIKKYVEDLLIDFNL